MAEAFERLGGTRITTNIKADGEEITNGFGLIDSFRIVRSTPTGRLSEVQVRLADRRFKIIQGSEVLTLSRDYFRLRKPIEPDLRDRQEALWRAGRVAHLYRPSAEKDRCQQPRAGLQGDGPRAG